tara:strand:- start:37 stop:264 length:228 start_codon:yes stop_codon:yes gene_type:complete
MDWINVKDRLPEHGVTVLVFRPQVLKEDHTDKPIREAYYNKNARCFSCWHQPTEWAEIEKPSGWNENLNNRQIAT